MYGPPGYSSAGAGAGAGAAAGAAAGPIGAGLGLAQMGVSAIIDHFRGRRNRRHQRRMLEWQFDQERAMSDLAYQRDVEMWNRMNAYNTPAQQMERFKQAGLNPHLIYGKGTPGNVTQTPQYQRPNVPDAQQIQPTVIPNLDFIGGINQYQQMRQSGAQVENTKANTALQISKTGTEAYKQGNLKLAGDQMAMANRITKETIGYQIEQSKQSAEAAKKNVSRIAADIGRIKAQKRGQNKENALKDKRMELLKLDKLIKQRMADSRGATGFESMWVDIVTFIGQLLKSLPGTGFNPFNPNHY